MNATPWRGRRVMVTGHTGFKGAWLTAWLRAVGAEVTGLALEPATTPDLFSLLDLAHSVEHVVADVRDRAAVGRAIARARPEMIFHLAAQAFVRTAYAQPLETFATNVMGTANVLDAARGVDVAA
ncbi:MAG: GDP-mannose 4,6-dehydratase, partial [Vulcanimicrobiaceae bacterium]